MATKRILRKEEDGKKTDKVTAEAACVTQYTRQAGDPCTKVTDLHYSLARVLALCLF